MNIALFGYGYWGLNLLRNLKKINLVNKIILIDKDTNKLRQAKKDSLELEVSTTSSFDLKNRPDIDCAVIATPVSTHYNLAKDALLCGKHVLVEKPLTSSVQECEKLIEISEKKDLVLMVDHTYIYTSAVQKIKSLVDEKELGVLNYFDSTRINLGLFQNDINVLWDLASHDLSILNYLVDEMPQSVSATGISHMNDGIHNIGYLTLFYDFNFIAHIACSWSSPVKIRHTLIGGNKKMILYNDLEATEKVKIYDTGYDVINDIEKNRYLIDYRIGDIYLPFIERKEALFSMCMDFIECCQNDRQPIADKISALKVVRILEAAQESIELNKKVAMLD